MWYGVSSCGWMWDGVASLAQKKKQWRFKKNRGFLAKNPRFFPKNHGICETYTQGFNSGIKMRLAVFEIVAVCVELKFA